MKGKYTEGANEMVADVRPETVKKLPTGEFGVLLSPLLLP